MPVARFDDQTDRLVGQALRHELANYLLSDSLRAGGVHPKVEDLRVQFLKDCLLGFRVYLLLPIVLGILPNHVPSGGFD